MKWYRIGTDNYKKSDSYRYSHCGMMYTAVTWQVIIQSIADVLSLWSTTQTTRQLSSYHITIKIWGRDVQNKIKKCIYQVLM